MNLRDDLCRRLRSAITEGHLPSGSRIGHDESARQLGVSRTPLREAVLQLEKEGFVESHPGRGFRVAPLSVTEVEELYPLLACLERHALETGESFRKKDLRDLRTLLRRFPKTLADPAERIRCDTAIHEKLTSRCSNSKVQSLLKSLRAQAQRYEWIFSGRSPTAMSAVEHERIVDQIEAGRTARAGKLLEQHQLDCVPRLRSYVLERESSLAPVQSKPRKTDKNHR